MAYFPFFVDISMQEGLIVGGGTVALRKIEKLFPYGVHLTVAAMKFLPEIETLDGLTLVQQSYSQELLENKLFVIAATDDRALNHTIASQCRERHIPVNVVDDRDACTFLFPALVKRGDLSIGISTGGTSPSAAIHLKEQIEALLPEKFDSLLVYLDSLRSNIKKNLEDSRQRAAFFAHLYTFCLENGWPLSNAALQSELLKFIEGDMQ